MRGKTITTYLIHGHPKGPLVAFISNKICKALLVPRINLKEMLSRPEFNSPCIYFLLSVQEEQIYIGESESFVTRVRKHQADKDFWDQALIFTSKDNDLTKSDIKFLEYLAIAEISKSVQFQLSENKNTPKATNLPEHQLSTISEFFEDIKILTSFLGYSIFDLMDTEEKNQEVFYCQGRGADAKGYFTKPGFTVLKGSIVPLQVTNSYRHGVEKRSQRLRENSEKISESVAELTRDLLFSSPSAASSFCVGNQTNGWISWATKSRKTLDEIYRY